MLKPAVHILQSKWNRKYGTASEGIVYPTTRLRFPGTNPALLTVPTA